MNCWFFLDLKKNMGKVTINEIARLANVSKSTISRVLNESGPVSNKTRTAVLEAVRTLDFSPNEIARSLALKRTKTLGLIVQDIRNPYYANACWHSERIFRKFGYTTFIYNADNDRGTEEAVLTSMKFRNVDGVFCIGGQEDATSILNFISRTEIPIIMVDRELTGYNIPTVSMDNIFGGQIVTDYLFSLGHRRIAFVTSMFTEAEKQRLEGFMAAHRIKGVNVEKNLILSQSEELWHEGTCASLRDMLESSDRPTAIFASNDYKALRVLRILRQLGIAVPEEISLVGYDDIETTSLVHPALTTVHQPIEKMIEFGTEMLMDFIKGKEMHNKHKYLKPWLVERESSRRIA
jgi:LacI family transcriptional regulator